MPEEHEHAKDAEEDKFYENYRGFVFRLYNFMKEQQIDSWVVSIRSDRDEMPISDILHSNLGMLDAFHHSTKMLEFIQAASGGVHVDDYLMGSNELIEKVRQAKQQGDAPITEE